jgi:hypothetical protein
LALAVGYSYKIKKEQQKSRCLKLPAASIRHQRLSLTVLMQQNTDYKDFHQNPNLNHFQWAVIQASLHLTNYSLLRYRHAVKLFLMIFLIFLCC